MQHMKKYNFYTSVYNYGLFYFSYFIFLYVPKFLQQTYSNFYTRNYYFKRHYEGQSEFGGLIWITFVYW